jgi:ZIP family zinc transporter
VQIEPPPWLSECIIKGRQRRAAHIKKKPPMFKAVSHPSWSQLIIAHARTHPKILVGFGISVLGVLALLFQGQVWLNAAKNDTVRWALWGGMAGFLATTLGALPVLFLRGLSQKTEDVMLGAAAGMMLAAAAFSLLLPGLAAGKAFTGTAVGGAGLVVLGMTLGVMLMLGLDQFTPHEHDKTGPCGPGNERCNRVWLFVMAVAIHNLPEGMAVGVSFAQGDLSVGLPLATAIALQDLPEGLAVAMTLRSIGMSAWKAIGVAALGGFLEPIGALMGVSLVGTSAMAYPVGLGLAAGAMLFVVSHEVIPETHRNGHQTSATIGLMAGFAIMMVLDTTLG